ncbi:MAG: hypothetical protein RLZZ256_626 [Bacteroidota bacterium]
MRLRIWIAIIIFFILIVFFLLFRPQTINKKAERIFIKDTLEVAELCDLLHEKNILKNSFDFRSAAAVTGLKHIKPGSYRIQPKENLVQLIRRFHGNRQTPLNLIIGNERVRIRTIEQFAAKMHRFNYTLVDSAQWSTFLQADDSLRDLGLNHFNVLTRMMPLSYEIYWTESPRQVLQVLNRSWDRFWDSTKKQKAKQIGLDPTEVSILASIVEEETQHAPDRGLIASTYLNRLRIGMRLQADPTAKYASGDLNAKRVTAVHLRHQSPYNTYLVNGLPPGPICLPSIASLEAVLNAPKTDYLYFVASHRFDGTSVFTKDYSEHLKNAKRYQDELTRRNIR